MKLRLGILVGIFMAFLSLYPQIYFQIKRGENYNGATFYYDFDECNYVAYLQALIDGRSRKNSIYQGGEEPLTSETLYSIQFGAPYLVAVPSNILGISAETAFLFISLFFSFFISLSVYFLIFKITENQYLSAVGTIFILLFGANIAGISILKEFFGFGASAFYLPFLRRYTPAIAFPFVFILIYSLWGGLNASTSRQKYLYCFLAIVCFTFLVYSYFFYWTAMIAWLLIIFLLNILFRKQDWNFWAILFGGIFVSLIPYFFLISDRHPTTDSSQALEQTRKLVILRPTLIFGLYVFLAVLICLKMRLIKLKNQTTILVISLTLLPLAVFNQQIITGYSLQPMHFNMYILNYLVLTAFILLISDSFKTQLNQVKNYIWLPLALLMSFWGVIEINYSTRYRFSYNVERDQAIPVNQQLAKIGKNDFSKAKNQITLNFDGLQADNQPTIAPQGVLWATHLLSTGDLSSEETKNRYFLYLFLQDLNENWLLESLKGCPNETCRALLGWGVNPTLGLNYNKIDDRQINSLTNEYKQFLSNLTSATIFKPTISYVVVPDNMNPRFTNLDKWYERDSGEKFGNFTLYKVRPLK